jgi:hypothetical protein
VKIFLTLLALILMSGLAQARLGDNFKELEARYGKPIGGWSGKTSREENMRFIAMGYKILVVFLDRKSQSELLIKADDKASFNETELNILLSAYSGGGVWKLRRDDSELKEWHLEDETAFAQLMKTMNPEGFLVYTKEFQIYYNTYYTKRNNNALEGF